MELRVIQIILLSLYAFVAINDQIHSDFGLNRPLLAGCFAGIVMGDLAFGLTVGATLQLMVLGVSNFGGSSIPDFMSAALIGTALGVISGQGEEFGIGLAVPAGMLLVQIDVLARFANTFFQHQADKYAEEVNLKKIEMMNILGVLMWGLSRAVPVFICLILGSKVVTSFVSYFPVWLSSGLKVAGGLLPAVGIAILLRYLPTKKYIPYLLMGFVLAAYLGVPMLGVAICGLALALLFYRQGGFNEAKAETGGMDDDE
ncbi:MAG: PTS sugar transporter subunit IIC [Lachnospiraceae bacterium]|nr:PTS sugar transporter subunit IIC [Lachnospiraceae bacterium]